MPSQFALTNFVAMHNNETGITYGLNQWKKSANEKNGIIEIWNPVMGENIEPHNVDELFHDNKTDSPPKLM